MFNTGFDMGLLMTSLQRSESFIFVDVKGDFEIVGRTREMAEMAQRKELAQAECRRLGVRFLPLQVLRLVWAAAGVKPGRYKF